MNNTLLNRNAFFTILSFFMLLLISCNKDETENEDINPNLREGFIEIYANNEKTVFRNVFETPYTKFSQETMNNDTLGFTYSGYNALHSGFNSIIIKVLNTSLALDFIEYHYHTDNDEVVIAKWDKDNELDHLNPLEYKIEEKNNILKGFFKGNLYNLDRKPTVIDSCILNIHK